MLAADEVPLSNPARSRLYAQLGGYEASKREGDATPPPAVHPSDRRPAATGRSSPTSADPGTWLATALAAASTTAAPVLVGHSLGAATILEHLAAGGQARAAVLISPFFLQRPAPWALRAPFAPALLRRATAARLAGTVLDAALDGATEPVYQASARNLRRRGVARAVASALRRTSTRAARDRLQRLLDTIDLPVVVVAGERDPLRTATRHRPIPGALQPRTRPARERVG
jgi:pimeloyl-ACP methyl ester carboxylesterase